MCASMRADVNRRLCQIGVAVVGRAGWKPTSSGQSEVRIKPDNPRLTHASFIALKTVGVYTVYNVKFLRFFFTGNIWLGWLNMDDMINSRLTGIIYLKCMLDDYNIVHLTPMSDLQYMYIL